MPSGADPETMNSTFVGDGGVGEAGGGGEPDAGADADPATAACPGEVLLPVEPPPERKLIMAPATTSAPMTAKMLRTQREFPLRWERCPAGWGAGPAAGGAVPGCVPVGGCRSGSGCVCGVHAVPSHQRRTRLPPGSVYQPGCGGRGSCGGCAPGRSVLLARIRLLAARIPGRRLVHGSLPRAAAVGRAPA